MRGLTLESNTYIMTSGAVQPRRTGSSDTKTEKWRRIAPRFTKRHDSRLIAKQLIEPQGYGFYADRAPDCGGNQRSRSSSVSIAAAHVFPELA